MHITDLNLISSYGGGVMRHHHTDEHEFHFIIKGHGIFTNRGRELPMDDNRLFYSAPLDAHTMENRHPEGYLVFYFVRFLPDKGDRELMRNIAELFGPEGMVTAGAGTHPLFEKIKLDTATGNPHLHTAAVLRFTAFMHELCADRGTTGTSGMNRHVMAAVRLLQGNIHGRLNLNDLAGRVGLEKSYLVRLFKNTTGTTPGRYLLKMKIDSARYLLRHTDRPVNRIAEELGFYDEFHFSRVFKKSIGTPPSRYRAG